MLFICHRECFHLNQLFFSLHPFPYVFNGSARFTNKRNFLFFHYSITKTTHYENNKRYTDSYKNSYSFFFQLYNPPIIHNEESAFYFLLSVFSLMPKEIFLSIYYSISNQEYRKNSEISMVFLKRYYFPYEKVIFHQKRCRAANYIPTPISLRFLYNLNFFENDFLHLMNKICGVHSTLSSTLNQSRTSTTFSFNERKDHL